MNKTQALRDFNDHCMPLIREAESKYGNGIDQVMRREEWNNYTDSLCKDGLITDHQYNTWSNPF